jgi:drug/metabolite transporter (DMT)-like permease
METTRTRTVCSTGLALTAFAANSLLCRAALGHAAIDPASFSSIRLASGAGTLLLITLSRRRGPAGIRGSWGSAALLFLYAVPFSYAYVDLGVGTGALILFGAVQATMLTAAMYSGERLHLLQWAGLTLAVGGLVYLVRPGLAAPAPIGCGLMTTAGVAWGVYSLRGRGASDPLAETAGNFVRAVPLAIVVSVATVSYVAWNTTGTLLAVLSGALASGVGYAVWYAALTGLTAAQAASVQLAVPVIAAAGGVIFLLEPVTTRLIFSAALILGGVGLALARREPRRPRPHRPEARPRPEPAARS